MYLVLYFLGIYLTIVNNSVVKNLNRIAITYGLHLILTVPSSFYLAKQITSSEKLSDNFILIFIITLLLVINSLLISGFVIKRIQKP